MAGAHGLEAGKYFFNNLSLTVIPMSVSLMCILRSWDRPELGGVLTSRMADLVFGVYLVHPVFIDAIKFLGLFAPTANQLAFIPAASAAVLALSFAAAHFLGRLPGLRRVL